MVNEGCLPSRLSQVRILSSAPNKIKMKEIKFLISINLEDSVIIDKYDVNLLHNKLYEFIENELVFGSEIKLELVTNLDTLILNKDPYV